MPVGGVAVFRIPGFIFDLRVLFEIVHAKFMLKFKWHSI